MKLVGIKIAEEFKQKHADSRSQMDAWQAEVRTSTWKVPQDIKMRYPSASFLPKKYVVFNICGNKYRLLAQVSYKSGIVLISKIGTHKEYDRWVIDLD